MDRFSDETQRADRPPQKLARLLEKADLGGIDFEKRFVAIKMHFGEPGNISYLRPSYAKVLADFVRARGVFPFLTDCNTLYAGRRKNALEHLAAAQENGFNPQSTGCQILIADGLKGTDETLVPIDGELVREAKIGSAIMDADVFISLAHFKGHEEMGFGGAMKNIGMGSASRAGKMEQHYNGKALVNPERCRACGQCFKTCAFGAIAWKDGKAFVNRDICVGCGRCIGACNFDAMEPAEGDSSNLMLAKRMAEYAWAVTKDRPAFYASIIQDVSPYCDCHAENDAPIVPNLGMFCSFDPIALDQACAEQVNAAPKLANSLLAKRGASGDHFRDLFPETRWQDVLEHGEKLGMGTRSYTLKKF